LESIFSNLNHSLVEFMNVSVARDTTRVLDRINLSIADGEHVAIIGPNGSGKSTLIKTITRECYPLLEPETSLRIMGKDRWNVLELRVMLGIVSNDLMQLATREVSGRDAVLSGFFSSFEIYPGQHEVTEAMEERTDQVMALLEIEHLAERSVAHLSSGEARRILIGRALVHDPKALVLDEPTNSLDLRAHLEFRTIVEKIARSGVTIILVTHNLPDIIPDIRRVILMKAGRIFRDGPKSEVLTSATLSELFGIPLQLSLRDGYYQLW
jgi:iron complex transport system ATP-binding protein